MDFGEALKALKQGKRIRRAHWGVVGQYIMFRRSRTVAADRNTAVFMGVSEGAQVKIRDYVVKRCSDGSMAMIWTPTWDDITAEDWEEVV